MRKVALLLGLAVGLLAVPVSLIAQTTPTTEPPTAMEMLLTGLLPVLVAFVTPYVYAGVQSVVGALKTLPDLVHQTLVFVIAYALTWAFQAIGVPAPFGLEGLTPDLISAALSALGSMGIYDLLLKKPRPV